MDNNYSCLKLENVCRTCLSEENLRPLFSEDYYQQTDMDFTAVILAVTQLEVTRDDGLPEFICETCQQTAELAHGFITKAHEANSKLREQLRADSKLSDQLKFTENTNNSTALKEYYSSWENVSETASFEEDDSKQENPQFLIDKQEIEVRDIISSTKYMCSICKKSFRSKKLLETHVTQNHMKRRRGRPRKDIKEVLMSSKSKKGERKPKKDINKKCFFCDKLMPNKELIKHYETDHTETQAYRCNLCNAVYFDYELLKSHGQCLQTDDGDNTAAAAINNDQDIIELSYETVFLHSLLPPADFKAKSSVMQCLHCGCLAWSKADLKQHIDEKHVEKSLRCNICFKDFATLRYATRHKASCDGTDSVFTCDDCGLEFSGELSLNKHILSQHVGAKASVTFINKKRPPKSDLTYPCKDCDMSFSREDLLTEHIRNHKKKFECHICKRKFTRIYNLWSHARVHDKEAERVVLKHARPKLCLCTFCGQGFSNTSNLIVHVRRHTGEKPYKCDFCDKAYPRSYDLAMHRRTHTGEKPCSCPICGKGFSRSNKLTRHMHTHTGQKPYKCTYCDRAFAQSNDLRVHIRRHTGDKPYICECCGERFIHGSALQMHRRAQGHYPPSTSTLPPSGYLPLKHTDSSDPSNDLATLNLL